MTQAIANDNPLRTERIGKLMVRFAVPSIISLVVNSLYNMVDQIFIGQGIGYLGNAATNVILPLTTFMMALSVMVGDGAAAFMSLSLGQGKQERAAHGKVASLGVSSFILQAALVLVMATMNNVLVKYGAESTDHQSLRARIKFVYGICREMLPHLFAWLFYDWCNCCDRHLFPVYQ